MLRTRATLILSAAALLLAACGPSISVNSDWSPGVEWTAFKTYKWLPDAQSAGAGRAANQITDQRIRMAMDSVFQARGLTKVESGSDLMVGYQVTTRTNVSYQTTSTGWGMSGGWGRPGWHGGTTTMRTVPIYSTAGTLIISVFETDDKSLLWNGSGQTDLQNMTDSQQRQRRINQVVERILEKFPPPK